MLQALPEPYRSMYLLGDWDAGLEDDAFQAIPTAWIMAAQARWRERSRPEGPAEVLGIDVARGGKDKTVVAPVYDDGQFVDRLHKWPGAQTSDGPAAVTLIAPLMAGGAQALVDVIGIG